MSSLPTFSDVPRVNLEKDEATRRLAAEVVQEIGTFRPTRGLAVRVIQSIPEWVVVQLAQLGDWVAHYRPGVSVRSRKSYVRRMRRALKGLDLTREPVRAAVRSVSTEVYRALMPEFDAVGFNPLDHEHGKWLAAAVHGAILRLFLTTPATNAAAVVLGTDDILAAAHLVEEATERAFGESPHPYYRELRREVQSLLAGADEFFPAVALAAGDGDRRADVLQGEGSQVQRDAWDSTLADLVVGIMRPDPDCRDLGPTLERRIVAVRGEAFRAMGRGGLTRKEARRQAHLPIAPQLPPSEPSAVVAGGELARGMSGLEEVEARDERESIERGLSERQRLVQRLKGEGFPWGEIAARAGCSKRAAQEDYRRAREHARQRINSRPLQE